MKKRLLTYGILFNAMALFAQNSPPTVQWIRSNNGQQSESESAVKSVKDNNGNYYVLANTGSDAVIAKFDNSGAAVNNFRYNEASNNSNYGYDIETDATGNLYIGGEAFVTSEWNWKPTIVKMSPAGVVVWEQIIPCTYYTNSQAQAIALDNNGNVYFAGANSDSLSVGLISSSGTLLWEKKIVPAGYTIGEAFDVVVDGSNAAYVTGKIKDSLNGDYEYITFKINSSGTLVWTKILAGLANGDDSGTNIEIDGSGNSYVTGIIADTSAANFSALLVKYNASGGQQWVKKLHMSAQTEAMPGELVLDAAGNCYIAINHHTSSADGYTHIYKYSSAGVFVYGTTYNDGSYTKTEAHGIRTDAVGNVFIGGTKYNGCCAADIFVAKFNAAGTYQWNNNYNSAGSDNGVSLHLDNGNNAIVTGNGSPSGISTDVAVVKYSSAGTFQWDGFYNGSGNPNDRNIKIFNQGNYSIYSVGHVSNEASGSDVLLSKYDSEGNILWQNVLDYNGTTNTARDMDHDNNYNISILADLSFSSSVVAYFDSIGSPIFTTNLASGYQHTCMKQDNSGNIFTSGGYYFGNTKDFCVAKITPSGSVSVQTTPVTAALFSAMPADLDVDNNGRFYAFGYKAYDMNGSNAYKKFMLQRYNANGTLAWSVDVAGVDSVGTMTELTYYWFAKKIILDNSNNSYVFLTARPQGDVNKAAIVVKYDVNGAEVWRWEMNNNDVSGEEAVDMELGPNNSLYVVTNSSSNGKIFRLNRTSGAVIQQQPITGGNYNLTLTAMNYGTNSGNLFTVARGFGNGYEGDVVLTKMDSTCNVVWQQFVGGTYSGDDWPTGISLTGNGRVYVSAGLVMNNGTETDAAVIKFCDIAENVITATGNTQNICPGNSVTLNAGNAAAYQWNVMNETDTTMVASVSGDYFCTTYKADGCWKNTDTITVTIKNAPSAPAICQVTVDTASTHNIVYWDKSLITDADSVRIYREDVTNVYTYIGSVSVDDPGEFNDTVADPNVTTKRYKISAIDSCGNESSLSLYHNTIYIVYNGLGQFSWNPLYTIESSPNPVNNYVLMRDDSSTGNWQQVSITAGTQSTIVDPNYNSYQSGSWRVETVWNIQCDPTRAIINTSRSNVKGQLAGPALGIEETQQVFVDFAPNPFSEQTQITIRTGSGKINCLFELFDETGRIVRNDVINNSKFMLEKGELAPGIYFYSISDRESKSANKGKLIIQH